MSPTPGRSRVLRDPPGGSVAEQPLELQARVLVVTQDQLLDSWDLLASLIINTMGLS